MWRGGVLLYIRNELNPSLVSELCNSSFTESVWCSIKCTNNCITVGVVYRAPDSPTINDEVMYKLFDSIYDKKVLIMGDFNFPELNWCDRNILDISHPFIDCISSNFLDQYCNEPLEASII